MLLLKVYLAFNIEWMKIKVESFRLYYYFYINRLNLPISLVHVDNDISRNNHRQITVWKTKNDDEITIFATQFLLGLVTFRFSQ